MENEEIVKHVDLVSSSAPRYSRLAKRRAEAMVLFHDKVVGHAGNIVADNAVAGLLPDFLLMAQRKGLRRSHKKLKQLGDYPLCHLLFRLQFGAEIQVLVQKRAEMLLFFLRTR